jgi:hypothetical protein
MDVRVLETTIRDVGYEISHLLAKVAVSFVAGIERE